MYISCPKCNTNFMVLPEQIGPSGRKVKCSKCSNIWHQKLLEPIKLEPLLSGITTNNTITDIPLGSGINLPALLPIKIPQYLFTLPVLLISLIIFLSVIFFQDNFGMRSASSLKFINIKDVHVLNKNEESKIELSYKIVNSSSHELKMPLVRVRLFDKDKKLLKSHIVDQSNITLSPKQYVNIKTEFASIPISTEEIDITLGNMLDFIFR